MLRLWLTFWNVRNYFWKDDLKNWLFFLRWLLKELLFRDREPEGSCVCQIGLKSEIWLCCVPKLEVLSGWFPYLSGIAGSGWGDSESLSLQTCITSALPVWWLWFYADDALGLIKKGNLSEVIIVNSSHCWASICWQILNTRVYGKFKKMSVWTKWYWSLGCRTFQDPWYGDTVSL